MFEIIYIDDISRNSKEFNSYYLYEKFLKEIKKDKKKKIVFYGEK